MQKERAYLDTLSVVLRRWRRLTLRCLLVLVQAALRGVSSLWHVASSRVLQEECVHDRVCLRTASNRYADQLICDANKGGCGAILSYIPTANAMVAREAKITTKKSTGNLETRAQHLQSDASPIGADQCPRCLRGFHRFRLRSGQVILHCDGWKVSGKNRCTFIKALPGETLQFGVPKVEPKATATSKATKVLDSVLGSQQQCAVRESITEAGGTLGDGYGMQGQGRGLPSMSSTTLYTEEQVAQMMASMQTQLQTQLQLQMQTHQEQMQTQMWQTLQMQMAQGSSECDLTSPDAMMVQEQQNQE